MKFLECFCCFSRRFFNRIFVLFFIVSRFENIETFNIEAFLFSMWLFFLRTYHQFDDFLFFCYFPRAQYHFNDCFSLFTIRRASELCIADWTVRAFWMSTLVVVSLFCGRSAARDRGCDLPPSLAHRVRNGIPCGKFPTLVNNQKFDKFPAHRWSFPL